MISLTHNTLGFKAVYYDKSSLNTPQKKVAYDILNKFRMPILNQSNSLTYETKYEHMGYDFVIIPDGHGDRVSVSAIKESKYDINSNKKAQNEIFYIGSYDLNNSFNINEVEKEIKNRKQSDKYFLISALAAIAVFVFMPMRGCINAISGENIGKNNILITDTIKKTISDIKYKTLDNIQKFKK